MALPEPYSQLVDKVASQGIPAWLGVGGSNGDIIPRSASSGLYHELPIRELKSLQNSETYLPEYKVGAYTIPVPKFISRSGDYIANFDVDFKNWGSSNEFIYCRMFEFNSRPLDTIRPLPGEAGEYKSAALNYGPGLNGICADKYWGPEQRPTGTKVNILIIGQIQWLERFSLPVSAPNHNSWYVYIIQRSQSSWVRVGAGIFLDIGWRITA
jgi:hypothetical protein